MESIPDGLSAGFGHLPHLHRPAPDVARVQRAGLGHDAGKGRRQVRARPEEAVARVLVGSLGWFVRSTSTVTVAPGVRVKVTGLPYTEPFATRSVVAPPWASVPFTTLTGMSTVNGAPEGTTARTWSVPTFSTVTVSRSGSARLPSRVSRSSPVRPANSPSGSSISLLLYRVRKSATACRRTGSRGAISERCRTDQAALNSVRPANSPSGSMVSCSGQVRSPKRVRPENTRQGANSDRRLSSDRGYSATSGRRTPWQGANSEPASDGGSSATSGRRTPRQGAPSVRRGSG